ncbi:MAG: substrate-binding domain-containing protein [Frankiales bacterium]|nr:substrate-binding domain-containing protein [Frankiales bacterium]
MIAGVTAIGLAALGSAALADPDTNNPGTYISTSSPLVAGVGADADAELIDHVAGTYDAQNPAPAQLLESYDAVNPLTGVAGETVQTKPGCSLARPNGANKGISVLMNNTKSTTDSTQFCVDFARSSRAKKTDGTEAGLTFWEFAPDAVTWATVGTAYAPRTPLTPSQLQGIFTCQITDWSDVGGQPGEIHVYQPPTTAGTYTFFLQAIGTDVATVTTDCSGASNVFPTQQNDGTKLLADPQGIAPYSVSKWAGQKNASDAGVTGINDLRGGAALGLWTDATAPTEINSTLGTSYTVLNPAFGAGSGRPGRFLYNVTRGGTTPSNIPAWADSILGTGGYICTNEDQLLIPFGTTPLGTDTGQSHYCGQQF